MVGQPRQMWVLELVTRTVVLLFLLESAVVMSMRLELRQLQLLLASVVGHAPSGQRQPALGTVTVIRCAS